MKAAKKQKERRYEPFKFTYDGCKSWFYLYSGRASFHQLSPHLCGQHDVHGLSIKTLINALKKCGYIMLLLCLPAVVDAKEVVIPYDDFLVMVSKAEHSEKLKNKAMAENGVLVKLKGEYETIIKIQADQIQACEAIVQQQEQLGATQEQIVQSVEQKLAELTGQLTREKRLSRYKSETVWIGLIGLVVWVLN